jgi:hypothetical protein
MMGLVLVIMIVCMNVVPALAKDKYKGVHDNGRYDHRGRGYERNPFVHGQPL